MQKDPSKPLMDTFINVVLVLDILHVLNVKGHKVFFFEYIDMDLIESLGQDIEFFSNKSPIPVSHFI